jgi:hypothetical protein
VTEWKQNKSNLVEDKAIANVPIETPKLPINPTLQLASHETEASKVKDDKDNITTT